MDSHELIKKQIGEQLRTFRENAGSTTSALAETLGISQSRLSRIENGLFRPTVELVAAAAKELRIPSKEKEVLLTAAKSLFAEYNSWQVLARNGLSGLQIEAHEIEAQTKSIRSFQIATIPGLLQTADYARCILSKSDTELHGDVDDAVIERLKRQAVMENPKKRFQFVISEAALQSAVCSQSIMKAQIETLVAVASKHNVSISILPLKAKPPVLLWTSFTLFDDWEVRLETLTAGITVTDPAAVKAYAKHYRRLSASSIPVLKFLRHYSK